MAFGNEAKNVLCRFCLSIPEMTQLGVYEPTRIRKLAQQRNVRVKCLHRTPNESLGEFLSCGSWTPGGSERMFVLV